MLRLIALIVFVCVGSAAYCQSAASHEPTSATDAEVRLHNTKKSRFHKATRARKSERIAEGVKDSKYKGEARATERHGKSIRRSRSTRKMNGEARVFRKHGTTPTNASTRKSKIKRSFGKDVE
jgi:hypothetical protein